MKNKLKLAVLGSPIEHSRSPQLHESFARDYGITDFSYERIETTCDTLQATVRMLSENGYDGFNCTMPLKTDIASIVDCISDEARALCSANTVVIKDGKLYAHTTDGTGILMTICRGYEKTYNPHESCVRGKRVILLGAGGAARSAAFSLKNAGAELTIVNRTLSTATALRDMLGVDCECFLLDDDTALCEAANKCDILINCTALGMSGKPEFKSLSFIDMMRPDTMVIDAVYNPLETALLKAARGRGLVAMSGLWMLVYQGAAAFEKWSGMLPDEDACQRAFELIK